MVSRSEQPAAGLRREEVIAALLSFVEQTTRASHRYREAGQWAEMLGGTPNAQVRRDAGFTAAIVSGTVALNDCLRQVGGVQAAWTDPQNGEFMQGRIMSCKEFNLDTGTWNLVFQSPMYSGLIGATPQRLHEIIEHNQPGLAPNPADRAETL
jgi:hypothetical protein